MKASTYHIFYQNLLYIFTSNKRRNTLENIYIFIAHLLHYVSSCLIIKGPFKFDGLQ